MLMSPVKMLIFRSILLVFGRFSFFSRVIKKLLTVALIKGKAGGLAYVAHSRFFDYKEFDGGIVPLFIQKGG